MKRRNWLLQAISPFPTAISKDFSVDTCGLFEKEFNGPEKEAFKNMSKSRLFAHDCISIKNKYSSFKLKGYADRLKS